MSPSYMLTFYYDTGFKYPIEVKEWFYYPNGAFSYTYDDGSTVITPSPLWYRVKITQADTQHEDD